MSDNPNEPAPDDDTSPPPEPTPEAGPMTAARAWPFIRKVIA